jgi:hypothetical protein
MTVLLALPSGPSSAAEGDLHVTLDYAVEASLRGCWQEDEFRRSVAHRIGYDPFREGATLNVRVRVGGTITAVDGHVEWRKTNGLLMGERRFVAKDGNCTKLMTEMSFAVGLQIELLRPKPPAGPAVAAKPGGPSAPPTDRAPETSAASGATMATASTSRPPAPPPAAPPKGVETGAHSVLPTGAPGPWQLWAGLGPSLAWGFSPHLTPDLRVFAGARRGDLSIEIAAAGTYPSSERRWDGSGFRETLLGGSLALCGHRGWLSGCALGRLSAILVRGLDVDRPRSAGGLVGQTGLRIAATLPVGERWFVAAHVDGLVLLNSAKVVLNQATVWDMPHVGLAAGIDVALRFR